MQSRYLMGTPLVEALAAPTSAPARARVPAASIACLIAATGALPLVVLAGGWLAQAAAGLASLVLYGTAWWMARRAHRQLSTTQALAASSASFGVDARALEALDAMLESVSTELPTDLVQPLLALKKTLVRGVSSARSVGVSEYATAEDRMYLSECIRRYLPDSLSAYLRVPAGRRGDVLGEEGVSANQALSHQLALIQSELDRQEARLASSASEALLLQQKFLQAKAHRSP